MLRKTFELSREVIIRDHELITGCLADLENLENLENSRHSDLENLENAHHFSV